MDEAQTGPGAGLGGPVAAPRVSTAPEVRYDDGTLAEQLLGEELDEENKELLLPDMTQEETISNLTSWGKPLIAVRPPLGTSLEMFRDVIAGAYQTYLAGDPIKPDTVALRIGKAPATVARVLDTFEAKTALEIRGVAYGDSNVGLTSKMDYALQIITDPHDGLTMQKKLVKAGITNATYQAWLRRTAFKAQIDRLSEQLINNNHEALMTIASEVGRGNLKAAQLQLEINGRYNPAREEKFDAFVMMQNMFEIIAKRITDPAILKAIAEDMRELADNSATVRQPRRLN